MSEWIIRLVAVVVGANLGFLIGAFFIAASRNNRQQEVLDAALLEIIRYQMLEEKESIPEVNRPPASLVAVNGRGQREE